MAAWAPAAEATAPRIRRPRRARSKPVSRAAPRRERTLAGGVLWIALLAALLAGIVALNVAVLRLNLQVENLGRDRVDLRARTAELRSQISSSEAAPRIESLARSRLGLVQAEPSDTTYVELPHGP